MAKSILKKCTAVIISLSLALCGLVITPQKADAAGTTYYVDAVNGNDNNNGTSSSTAWKTLSKVNNTTFAAGDQILFKKGCIWNGTLYPKGSGMAGSPITIDMFGSGNKPIIDGGGTVAAPLYLYNQQYWEINNLELTNNSATAGWRFGALITTGGNGGTFSHIYLKNLYVHDVKGNSSRDTAGIAFRVEESTNPSKFDDILVENCTVTNVTRTGIIVTSLWCNRTGVTWGIGQYTPSTNVRIKSNYLDTIAGDGILVMACSGAVIEYNVVQKCSWSDPEPDAGIWPYNSDNTIMQFNEVYLTKFTGGDAQGFDVDSNCENTIVQYNYSHDNEGGFLLVCTDGQSNGFNQNTTARYNISQNDQRNVFYFSGPVNNTSIYNNTIYIGSGMSTNLFTMVNMGGYTSNTYNYNNIYYNLGSGGYLFSSSTNNVFDYNVFYGNHPSSEPSDSHKITLDPMLVGPGTGGIGRNSVDGYKLKPGSPCINPGMTISNNGARDYWGNTVPFSNITDRGAHEYTNDSPLEYTMQDDLNDWTKTASHSAGLALDTSNGSYLGDNSRAIRTNTNTNPAEYVVYQSSNIKRFTATALFATSSEPTINNFTFYTSSDGAAWTQQTGWSYTDSKIANNEWTKRIYTLNNIPSGVNYLKVEFPVGGSYSWNPNLSQVTISYQMYPASMIDDLNDWTKAASRSAGLVLDTANGSYLGDNSRAIRTNTNANPAEYIIYQRNNIRQFTITALFATSSEPTINNFTFYTSSNGAAWTQQTGWSYTDSKIANNEWTKRIYTLNNIPSGVNYLKVEFPVGGSYSWNPNLSQVFIAYN